MLYAIFLNSWWFKGVKNDISKCSIHSYCVNGALEQQTFAQSLRFIVGAVIECFDLFLAKNINLTIWRRLVSSLCTVNCSGEQTRLDWYIVATEQPKKRNIWHILSTFRERSGSDVCVFQKREIFDAFFHWDLGQSCVCHAEKQDG